MIRILNRFVVRPSIEWVDTANSLSNTTLFLVSRVGPTVFTIKDEMDHVFRVVLGNPHTCTCENNGNINRECTTCVHRLFCLIKVLKVPMNHELCFQLGLNDKQLDSILNGICIAVDKRKILKKEKIPRFNDDNVEDSYVMRQPLSEDQDETCPICQDEMTADQALTWCRKGCGNNIHAKCMMKFSQYKLSNSQDPSCPLCREPWDVTVLKADCRGKASLKTSFAPVHCSNCQCLQRGVFYRCIECSQSNVLGLNKTIIPPTSGVSSAVSGKNNKPIDLCYECFSHPSGGNAHQLHHFVSSDVRVEITQGLDWIPCKNPVKQSSISSGNNDEAMTNQRLVLMRELQNRELSVNDYEVLLQLDDKEPSLALYDLCIEALPLFNRVDFSNNHNQMKGRGSHGIINNHNIIHNTFSVSISTRLCWCQDQHQHQQEPQQQQQQYDHRQLRLLPCLHIAHDKCLRDDLKLLIADDSSLISTYRCSHMDCGKRIFFGLTRHRKSIKANKDSSTDAGNNSSSGNNHNTTAGAVATVSNAYGVRGNGDDSCMMVGIVGQGCFTDSNNVINSNINSVGTSNPAQVRRKSLRYNKSTVTDHRNSSNGNGSEEQLLLPQLSINNGSSNSSSIRGGQGKQPLPYPYKDHRKYHLHPHSATTTTTTTAPHGDETSAAPRTGRFGAFGGSVIPDWVSSERVDPLIFPQPTTDQQQQQQQQQSMQSNNNRYDNHILLPDSLIHNTNHLKLRLRNMRTIRNSNSTQQSRLKPLLSRAEAAAPLKDSKINDDDIGLVVAVGDGDYGNEWMARSTSGGGGNVDTNHHQQQHRHQHRRHSHGHGLTSKNSSGRNHGIEMMNGSINITHFGRLNVDRVDNNNGGSRIVMDAGLPLPLIPNSSSHSSSSGSYSKKIDRNSSLEGRDKGGSGRIMDTSKSSTGDPVDEGGRGYGRSVMEDGDRSSLVIDGIASQARTDRIQKNNNKKNSAHQVTVGVVEDDGQANTRMIAEGGGGSGVGVDGNASSAGPVGRRNQRGGLVRRGSTKQLSSNGDGYSIDSDNSNMIVNGYRH